MGRDIDHGIRRDETRAAPRKSGIGGAYGQFDKKVVLTPEDFGWKDYCGKKFSEDAAYELYRQTEIDAREVVGIIEGAKGVGKKDIIREGYIESIPGIISHSFGELIRCGYDWFTPIYDLNDRRGRRPGALEHLKISRARFPAAREGYRRLKSLAMKGIGNQGYMLFHKDKFSQEGFHSFYKKEGQNGVLTAKGTLLDSTQVRHPAVDYIVPEIMLESTKEIGLESVVAQVREYVSERWDNVNDVGGGL